MKSVLEIQVTSPPWIIDYFLGGGGGYLYSNTDYVKAWEPANNVKMVNFQKYMYSTGQPSGQ